MAATKDLKAADKKHESSKDNEGSADDLHAMENMEAFNSGTSQMAVSFFVVVGLLVSLISHPLIWIPRLRRPSSGKRKMETAI